MRRRSKRVGGRSARISTWSVAAMAGAILLAGASARAAEETYEFRHERVLGTSLALTVVSPSEESAKAAERQILAEIERLNGILSTYRADSELRRLSTTSDPAKCSLEMTEVLANCQIWHRRTSGAFSGQLGEVIDLWKQAEKDGKQPDAKVLADAVARAQKPAWQIDRLAGTVAILAPREINVDALAKGYIVDRALSVAAAMVPSVQAMLLDVGGDIRVWNRDVRSPAKVWTIRVADPSNSTENAPGVSQVELASGAIATSGSYARYWKIGEAKFSHILDGRTGRPVTEAVSATVIAPDCMTADALATSCMVLSSAEAVKLIASVPGAECLLVGADGKHVGTGRWKDGATVAAAGAAGAGATAKADPTVWPKGHKVTVSVTLGSTRERPIGAIWVEDAKGQAVAMLSLWGRKSKYYKSLATWTASSASRLPTVAAVTQATPRPGQHSFSWDGTNAAGKLVPPGTYTVRIELHDRRSRQRTVQYDVKVVCGPKESTHPLTAQSFVTAGHVNYGAN